MTALLVAVVLAVGLLGLLVAGLLRSHAEILRSLHALGAGLESTAPGAGGHAAGGHGAGGHDSRHEADFRVRDGVVGPLEGATVAADLAGSTPDDEAVGIAVLGVPHDTLVAFLSSGCSTCEAFWAAFAEPGLALPAGTRLVVVTRGEEAESPAALRRLAPRGVPVLLSTEAWEAYDVPGSPYFVHVEGPTGRVLGEGTAAAWPQVAQLLGRADGDARDRSGRRRRPRRAREPAGADGPDGAGRADGRSLAGPGDGAHREARADAELLAAGITPGHPSLWGGSAPPPGAGGDGDADRAGHPPGHPPGPREASA